jgi:elongation factor P--beta-lysine ligase
MVPFPNEKSNKSFTIQSARFRAGIIRKIRDFFQTRGALEVETPILSHAASTDCHIDVFKTRFEPFPGSPLKEDVFLQTSPEFHMKRLLAEGSLTFSKSAKCSEMVKWDGFTTRNSLFLNGTEEIMTCTK